MRITIVLNHDDDSAVRIRKRVLRDQTLNGEQSMARQMLGTALKTENEGERTECPLRGACALVVDDNEGVLTLNATIVKRMGLETLLAQSGEEALEVFARHRAECSIAILDVQMPGMDGIELCRELRRLEPALPVVIVSGNDHFVLEDAPDLVGTVDVLPKPYHLLEFQERVRSQICAGTPDENHSCAQCLRPQELPVDEPN